VKQVLPTTVTFKVGIVEVGRLRLSNLIDPLARFAAEKLGVVEEMIFTQFTLKQLIKY